MQEIAKVQGLDKVAEATERLVAMMESGDLPAAMARTAIRSMLGQRPSDAWSWGNQLLMILCGTEDARGFKQWKDAGRSVRKGAKAIYILGPRTVTRTVEDEKTGEQRKVPVVVGFVGIPVFRLEDTEGQDLETGAPIDHRPEVLPPLMSVAEAWGYTVTYGPQTGGAYGYHTIDGARIHLMTHDVGTLWHELAHGAHKKVLEARGDKMRGGQIPEQEIVAEMTAAVLGELYGETGRHQYTRDYLATYAKAMGTTLTGGIMRCLSDVQKCLLLILEAARTVEPAMAFETMAAAD